jgi:hypothetical protein
MSGWIKLHRQIIDWEWFDDKNTFRLFMYLLLKANHKERKYKGKLIEVGQTLTGLDLLSKEVGLTIQQIRTSLTKLKSTNEITIKTSSKGTIIQVVNYKKYQVVTNQITDEQQADNKQITTNKNDNKEKNEKEVLLDEWISYRKQIKKTLTSASIEKLKNEMALYSDEKCKFVINTSISNGWQGLFWDKYTEQPKQQTIISDFVYKDESNMTDEELWAYAKEKMEHRKKEIAIYG